MAHSCFYASQRGCRGALSTRWAETLHRQTCSEHKRTLLPRRASPRRQHNHSMNPLRGNAPHTCRLCDGYILHTSRLGGACRADILWVPGEGKLTPSSIATWRRYTPPRSIASQGGSTSLPSLGSNAPWAGYTFSDAWCTPRNPPVCSL